MQRLGVGVTRVVRDQQAIIRSGQASFGLGYRGPDRVGRTLFDENQVLRRDITDGDEDVAIRRASARA